MASRRRPSSRRGSRVRSCRGSLALGRRLSTPPCRVPAGDAASEAAALGHQVGHRGTA